MLLSRDVTDKRDLKSLLVVVLLATEKIFIWNFSSELHREHYYRDKVEINKKSHGQTFNHNFFLYIYTHTHAHIRIYTGTDRMIQTFWI